MLSCTEKQQIQFPKLHSEVLLPGPMSPSGAHHKYKAQRDSHKTEAVRYVAHSGAAYIQRRGTQSSVRAHPASKPAWFCLAPGWAAPRMLVVRFSTEQMGTSGDKWHIWWQGAGLCDDLVQPTHNMVSSSSYVRQANINMGTEATHRTPPLFIRLHTIWHHVHVQLTVSSLTFGDTAANAQKQPNVQKKDRGANYVNLPRQNWQKKQHLW